MISSNRILEGSSSTTREQILNLRNNRDINQSKKYIKCPECHRICLIKFKEYKFNLEDCGNNEHINNNIQLNDFDKTQKKRRQCNICNKFKNGQFFSCFECNELMCYHCKIRHSEHQDIIENELIDFLCNRHQKEFIYYYQF